MVWCWFRNWIFNGKDIVKKSCIFAEMDRNKLISELANDKYLRNYCNVLCKSDIANDIWQDSLLHICEMPQERFNQYCTDYKSIKKYLITQIYLLNLHRVSNKKASLCNLSDTSIDVFNLQLIEQNYNHEIDNTFDKVISILEDRSTIKESDMIIFFESLNNNMKNIEKDFNIPYVTIRSKRKRVIEKIKELIK